MPNDEILGYVLKRGHATAIKRGRSSINPLSAWFMGWARPDIDSFDASDEGLQRAYLASLWAYRCITLRGRDTAQIPLFVKNQNDEFVDRHGQPVEELPTTRIDQHILQRFLDRRYSQFRRQLEHDKCIWGRYYIEPTRYGLKRLNPSTMYMEKDNAGIHQFWQQLNGRRVAEWDPDQLVYVHEFNPADDLDGLSPLAFALQEVGAEVSLDDFVHAYFENDATPTGLLTTEAPLNQDQVTEIQGWWTKFFSGVQNKFKVGILGHGLKFEPMASDLGNLAIPELRLEVRRGITAAFGVPMTIALADEAANFSVSYEQDLNYYTKTIIPEVNIFVDELNKQLIPIFDHTGNLKIVADLSGIEVLQKFKAELSTARAGQYTAGTITLNEARRADGYPVMDEDYIVVPNIGLVNVNDLPKIAQRNAAPPPDPGGGFGATMAAEMASDIEPERPEPPFPTLPRPRSQHATHIPRRNGGAYSVMDGKPSVQPTRAASREAFVCLSLPSHEQLAMMRDGAISGVGTDTVDWTPPERWHCTLVYAENVPDSVLSNIGREIAFVDAVALQPQALIVLDGGDAPVLAIELERTPALAELQRGIFELFSSRGIAVSKFSKPARWRPHITLGILKPSFDSDDIPETVLDVISADRIQITREDYRVIREIRATGGASKRFLLAPTIYRTAAEADLRKYASKVKSKGYKSRFESETIPKVVLSFLQWDLHASQGDEDAIKSAFAKAEATLRADPAELADFLAYWDGVDDAAEELYTAVTDVLNDSTIQERLADHIEQTGSPETAITFYETIAEEQVNKLLGTQENPGPLAALFLAGAARGQQLYDKLQEENKPPEPKRHASAKQIEIRPAWHLMHEDAWQFARSYAFDLVKGINKTTATDFSTAMQDWIDRGGSLPGLIDMLKGRMQGLDIPPGWSDKKIEWATSKERARLIAQTESTRAFNEGNSQRWQSLGIRQTRYRNQNDRIICDFCRAMGGVIGDLTNGFPVPPKFQSKWGQHIKLPSHPGCILPGNRVDIPGVVGAAVQSFYRGRCVEITLANGSQLSVTQNHPILTPRGWLAAQLLHQGDDVLFCSDPEGILQTMHPDDYDVPPTIEQIWRALHETLSMPSISMPSATVKLNGDERFLNGDVDIVYTDSLLLNQIESMLSQRVAELGFSDGSATEGALSSQSILASLGKSNLLSPLGEMGICQHCRSLLFRSIFPTDAHGLADSSRSNTGANNILTQSRAANACASRDGLFGLAALVALQEFLQVMGLDFSGRERNTRLHQTHLESDGRRAKLNRQFTQRFARQITPSNIVKVRNFDFTGHVYDLHVDPYSLYICNGVVVKNCRCYSTPVTASRVHPAQAVDVSSPPSRQTSGTIAVGDEAARI